MCHFNPLSPHGERLPVVRCKHCVYGISIHSPRMGRDSVVFGILDTAYSFQSTLPAWGETLNVCRSELAELFQSTLPAWGETRGQTGRRRCVYHFNPLSPHGERRNTSRCAYRMGNFNPLSPHGERPSLPNDWFIMTDISIHSPRMGRDNTHCSKIFRWQFQSTLPAWGETLLRAGGRIV